MRNGGRPLKIRKENERDDRLNNFGIGLLVITIMLLACAVIMWKKIF